MAQGAAATVGAHSAMETKLVLSASSSPSLLPNNLLVSASSLTGRRAVWTQQSPGRKQQHGFLMGMSRVGSLEIKQSSQFGQTWNQSPAAVSGEGLG